MTDAGLPVPVPRLVAALRAEVARLARAGAPPAGAEWADVEQAGALAYLADVARGGATHPHARGMAAARGAMRTALAGEWGRRGKDHQGAGLQLVGDASLAAAAAPERAGWAPRVAGRRPWRRGLAALPRRVRRAVAQLPPRQQAALRLTLAGHDAPHVAVVLGCSSTAVHVLTCRAREGLRQRLSA